MYTQRKQDRRSFAVKKSFPLITKGGCLVKEDRRSIPDRRFSNIHLEMDDTAGHVFAECVADTPFDLSGKEDY